MQLTGMVIAEDQNTREGRTYNTVTILDLDQKGALINTVDYNLRDDESEKHAGKLLHKRVVITVTDWRVGFGNRMRFRGRIENVGESIKIA